MAELRPEMADLLQQVRALQKQADLDRRLIANLQGQVAVARAQVANLRLALETALRLSSAIGVLRSTSPTAHDVPSRQAALQSLEAIQQRLAVLGRG